MIHIVRERRLLNIWIVRASVAVCLLCFGIGIAIFLWHGGQTPASPSGSLLHILHDAAHSGWHAGAFLNAGLVILLLTPLARLVAGVYVSLRMRDWLYAVIGLIVITLVLVGLIAGQSSG